MAKKKVIIEPFEDTRKWLGTFNDLMTLLLTFFVLILSMSKLDAKSVKEVQQDLMEALGLMEAGKVAEETIIDKIFNIEDIGKRLKIFKNLIPPEEDEIVSEDMIEGVPLPEKLLKDFIIIKEEGQKKHYEIDQEFIFNRIKRVIAEDVLEPGKTIFKSKRGIVLRLADSVLFDAGDAALKDDENPLMRKVAALMNKTKLFIYVEGHTDSKPINTARFPSNWELSVSRAVSVVELLVQKYSVAPERIRAAGYGASIPLAPNNSPENRSKNRRIEIILSQS